jgi:Response regulator receiver domain
MPFVNGVKLSQEIRRINLNTPIIVASAYNEVSDFMELLNLNIEAFLPKPLDLGSFLHRVYSVAVKIDDARIVERYQTILEKHIISARKKIQEQSLQIQELKDKLCSLDSSNEICQVEIKAEAQDDRSNERESSYGGDDYFADINKEDRQDIADAIDDLMNHVLLIKNENGSVDRARLQCVLLELRRFTLLLSKSMVFKRLSSHLDELYNVLSNTAETALRQHDRLIVKLIEELAFVLENFVLDVVKVKSDHPNHYDDSIIADIDSVLIAINAKKIEESDTCEYELF